jgi:regulator of protease activity HflC (stomatin/prohibitin superfamily)
MSLFTNRKFIGLVSVLPLAGAAYAYVATNGVSIVAEGSNAVVARLDGSHSARLLKPGINFVVPVWESIRPVKLSQTTIDTGILKATTAEGLPIAAVLKVEFEREGNVEALAQSFDRDGNDISTKLIQHAIAKDFIAYGKTTTSLSFSPIHMFSKGTASGIKDSLNRNLELKTLGVNVTAVTIKKQWLTPELQVPIDAAKEINGALGGAATEARRRACESNPNCS